MKSDIFVSLAFVLAMLQISSAAQATKQNPGTLQDKYHVIQVVGFDIQSGVDIPPDYLASLPQEVVRQLKDSHKFTQVLSGGEKASPEDVPVICLTGTVTGYDAGSRGKRYVGFGMGAARLFVTLRYRDKSTAQIIYEDKLIGTLLGGVFGGNENKVVEELAKNITATTKLILLRRLGDPNNVVEQNAARADSNPAERQNVEMKGDLKLVETKLNEVASQGFRITDFRVTGNSSANVTMEKTATPAEKYHYMIVHAILAGNVQKNMNKAAAEGYRLVPHTVAMLAGMTLIMEKTPAANAGKYEYRVSSGMLMSNAEKHMAEDQQKGFVVVEAGKLGGINLVLTEKVIPAEEASR